MRSKIIDYIEMLEKRLAHTIPHTCKHCSFYDCNKADACRCFCAVAHEEIIAQIENLRELVKQGDEETQEILATP